MLFAAMSLIIVHNTYHTGQSRTVSLLPVLYVNLEILRNADSCSGLKIDQELDGHDPAVLHSSVLLVCNLCSLQEMFWCWLHLTEGLS